MSRRLPDVLDEAEGTLDRRAQLDHASMDGLLRHAKAQSGFGLAEPFAEHEPEQQPEQQPEPELPEMGHPEFRGGRPDGEKHIMVR